MKVRFVVMQRSVFGLHDVNLDKISFKCFLDEINRTIRKSFGREFFRIAAIHLGSFAFNAFGGLQFSTMDLRLEVSTGAREAEVSFPFENAGDQAVNITEVHASCDCTTTQLEKRRYAPGEGGAIKATFAFGERTGEQAKQVTVRSTENGREAVQRLTFRVRIPQLLTTQPIAAFWNTGQAPREQVIEVLCPEKEHAATGVTVEAAGDQMETKLEEVEPGKRYRLRLQPRSTAAPARTEILLTGDFGAAGKRTTKVFAYVK